MVHKNLTAATYQVGSAGVHHINLSHLYLLGLLLLPANADWSVSIYNLCPMALHFIKVVFLKP
jgi:hypothetical protein